MRAFLRTGAVLLNREADATGIQWLIPARYGQNGQYPAAPR